MNDGRSCHTAKARHDAPKATHGAPDRPLRIGAVEIPCYVLSGERRVLTLTGFTGALGMARGGSMVAGMNRLELFASRKAIKSAPRSLTAGFALVHDSELDFVALLLVFGRGILHAHRQGVSLRCSLPISNSVRLLILD